MFREAAMSENLFKLYVTQFSTILNVKLQQRTSKLRGRCMEGFHVGKQASPVQYIGAIQMKTPSGRFAPLDRQDVDFTRRWVFPIDKEAVQLIDSFDKLKLLTDPTSQYSDVAAAAVAREWDDRLIGASFATAQIGADAGGLSGEVFNASGLFQIASTFGSSAASGLTVAKMIEAKRIFRKAQVDVDHERSPEHHLGENRHLSRHLEGRAERRFPAPRPVLAALSVVDRHELGRDPARAWPAVAGAGRRHLGRGRRCPVRRRHGCYLFLHQARQ